jgi:1-acyl-sn-glycerol-3-phosphate acyltransferase
MWLLPLFPSLARAAAFVYYRVRHAGGRVPPRGPVLLVANHPNSLLDPMMVVAAARRPVRFLAKAPLFTDRKVGWLVKAAGAIPVHRRSDDPGQVERNDEMFRAVHQALAAGAAVAIFPEGLSHSEASLAPLRTGAARIALGAAPRLGGAFPILPIGLVFRRKEVFRSEARVLIGTPVGWDDLGSRGADDPRAVRDLTARIDEALRQQTINLDHWRDEPLVNTAIRVWEAERDGSVDPAERVARTAVVTRMLADIRQRRDADGMALVEAVRRHARRLSRLGLRPADLTATVGGARAISWAATRLPLVLPLWAAVAVAGWLLFVVPYRVTGLVVDRFRLEQDTRSTWKLMVAIPLYLAWTLLLALGGTLIWSLSAGLAVLAAAPVVGMVGLLVRERWAGSWRDARRWLLLRSRRSLVDALRADQRELGARLDRLYRDSPVGGAA